MDVLSDVLRVVRLSGAVFFTADLSAPWALESPSADTLASTVMRDAECVVLFHILVEGNCRIECEGHPATTMEAGDVIVLTRGDQHTMSSLARTTATPLGSVFSEAHHDHVPQVVFGGHGETSRFVCGYLNCDQRFSPLIEALPTMLLIRSRADYSAIEGIDTTGIRNTVVPQGSGTWLGTTLPSPRIATVLPSRWSRPLTSLTGLSPS